MGEPYGLAGGQILDVDVVLTYVCDLRRIGAELRVHQGRFGRIAADSPQLPGAPVEEPVVTARVGAPDATRVGEHEHALTVARPRKVLDIERRRSARWPELGRGDQHVALRAGGAVVPHHVHSRGTTIGRFDQQVRGSAIEPFGLRSGSGRELAGAENAIDHVATPGEGGGWRYLPCGDEEGRCKDGRQRKTAKKV